jgi:basic membrane lipoprotein Med (substrate-binding protein (PBP1-ABC) superfamily)
VSLAVALGTLCVALVSCRPSATVSPSKTSSFRVALLTPGPISDAGWNAAAYDGLQLIARRLGADVATVQTTSPADFDDAFRDFASRHFNLIFAHGFEYTDAALKAGREFSSCDFIVTSGSGSSANVASLSFKIEEAAYVEGVLAGSMTRSGVAGAIGGIELPAIKLTFDGFRRGFLAVRPDGRVLTAFIGSFDDVGAAKEAARAQISQGADILFHDADAAGLGVFTAARQAHVYAFGANRNQNGVFPDVVIASAVTSIPDAFLKLAEKVKAGTFHGGMIELGMKDGMVHVVINPVLATRIPSAAMDRVRRIEHEFENGTAPTLATALAD